MARKKRTTKAAAAPREHATPALREFGNHHDVETRAARDGGVQGWRVRTRLDALFDDKMIDAAEWQAGDNYRRDFEVGELGGRIAALGEGGGGGDGCPTMSRLASLARLAGARAQLSVDGRITMDGLVADLSWPMLGEKLGCGRNAARSSAVANLKILAEHYRLYAKQSRLRSAQFV